MLLPANSLNTKQHSVVSLSGILRDLQLLSAQVNLVYVADLLGMQASYTNQPCRLSRQCLLGLKRRNRSVQSKQVLLSFCQYKS